MPREDDPSGESGLVTEQELPQTRKAETNLVRTPENSQEECSEGTADGIRDAQATEQSDQSERKAVPTATGPSSLNSPNSNCELDPETAADVDPSHFESTRVGELAEDFLTVMKNA
ncbi:hypothetical protein B0H19DRAFT_1079219 [Mycena capillaripes]|nr:hypothetical protein B0H19DRAFT_1079219 [Mycena capillaripes]